jgi:cupin superfamily acireductone dioxygenase involved in methionine salvage
MMTLPQAIELVTAEVERATAKFSPFNSAHEGYAVIEEEFDELWDEIKLKERDDVRMAKEAVQLGAMAVRFLMDV